MVVSNTSAFLSNGAHDQTDEYPVQLFETNVFKNFSQKDFNDRLHIDEIMGVKMDEAVASVGE